MGMSTESAEFLQLEKDLARQGEPERTRLSKQIERVKEKKEKSAASKRRQKGKKAEANGGVKRDESSELSDVEG
jgi:hypothetical protein